MIFKPFDAMRRSMKFGGTSTVDGKTLNHIVESIILASPGEKTVVASAPRGMTDALIGAAHSMRHDGAYPEETLSGIESRFYGIADDTGVERKSLIPYFSQLGNNVRRVIGNEKAYIDSVSPYGEIIIAEILTDMLRQRGVDAVNLNPMEMGLISDGKFGNASPKPDSYAKASAAINHQLGHGRIVVGHGYYLFDENGNMTTMGRGGTDESGSIYANLMDADIYENYNHAHDMAGNPVTGIMSSEPRLISGTSKIDELNYLEAREMAISGAGILHSSTIVPLSAKGIPLNVRSAFELDDSGTYVRSQLTKERKENPHGVQGIAFRDNLAFVYLEKIGMDDQIGVLAEIDETFAGQWISIAQDGTGGDSLTIGVYLNGNRNGLSNVIDEIKSKKLATTIDVTYDMAIVSVVGEKMGSKARIMHDAESLLKGNGIETLVTPFTGSRRSAIFGIEDKYAVKAVQALHDAYVRNGSLHH